MARVLSLMKGMLAAASLSGDTAIGDDVTAAAATAGFWPFDVPTVNPTARLDISSGPADTHYRPPQVGVEFRIVQTPDSVRVQFRMDSIAVRLPDGRTTTSVRGSGYLSRDLLPDLGRPVRWLRDAPSAPRTNVSLEAREVDSTAIANGVPSARVTGTMMLGRSRIVATLPLRRGAMVARGGRRIRIYGFSHDRTAAEVWIQISAGAGVGVGTSPDGSERLQFVLVNDERAEAMLVASTSSSSSNGSIVLPWIRVSTTFEKFSTATGSSGFDVVRNAVLPTDDAWYANAHLAVVEWRPIGRYRTTAEWKAP